MEIQISVHSEQGRSFGCPKHKSMKEGVTQDLREYEGGDNLEAGRSSILDGGGNPGPRKGGEGG